MACSQLWYAIYIDIYQTYFHLKCNKNNNNNTAKVKPAFYSELTISKRRGSTFVTVGRICFDVACNWSRFAHAPTFYGDDSKMLRVSHCFWGYFIDDYDCCLRNCVRTNVLPLLPLLWQRAALRANGIRGDRVVQEFSGAVYFYDKRYNKSSTNTLTHIYTQHTEQTRQARMRAQRYSLTLARTSHI